MTAQARLDKGFGEKFFPNKKILRRAKTRRKIASVMTEALLAPLQKRIF